MQTALAHLRGGDILVVWKLDRLSRSLIDLLRILKKIDDEGAGFISLTESLDTTTPAGRLMMNMLGSFSQFEREIIRERTMAGLRRARELGHKGGGQPLLSEKRRERVIKQILSGEMTQSEAAKEEGVSKSTICRIMARAQEKEQKKMGLDTGLA